jgi:UMF1 family MFS transporter
LIVLLSYQLSLVFYNALLDRVSASAEFERVSGRGLAWGWVGGIVGVLIGLPLSKASPEGGMNAILVSALVAAGLSVISLYLISKSAGHTEIGADRNAEAKGLWAELDLPRRNRAAWVFLLAYFLFSDAILTIQNNSTIYMEVVLKLTDTAKAYQFLLILLTSAMGSLVSVPLVRTVGLKKALRLVLAACAVTVLVTPAFTSAIGFTLIFAILGLVNGAVWNISRVLFFRLIPISRKNTYFGFYSTFERFASILGPVAWSIPVTFIHADVFRYQAAWMTMSVFLFVSILFMTRLRAAAIDNSVQSGTRPT